MATGMIGTRPLTKEESELELLYGKPVTVYHILQSFSRDRGVKHHLKASHDLFDFNFRLSENGHPNFDVSVKPDAFKNGLLNFDLEEHPRVNYKYRSKSRKRGQRVGRKERKSCKIFDKYADVVPRDETNELPHVNGNNISSALTSTHLSENSNDIPTITQPEIGQCSKGTHVNGALARTQPEIGQCSKGPHVNGGNVSSALPRTQPEIGQCSKGPHVNGGNVSSALPRTHFSENINDIQTITQPEIGQCSKGPHVNGDNVSSALARTQLPENSSDIPTITQLEIGQCSKGPHVNGDNISTSLTRTPLSRKTTQIQTRTQPKRGQSSNTKGPDENGDNISSSLTRTPLSKKTTLIKTRFQPKRGQSSKAKGPDVNGTSLARTRLTRKASHIQTVTQPEIGQSSKAKRPGATRRKGFHPQRIEDEGTDLLRSRQFYHSRTLQPMTLEEVLSEADSDNERDEVFQDLQERLRLNQLVDATDEQKRFMSLWNNFMRNQTVVGDKHVPLACEKFVKLHAKELIKIEMIWQWKTFALYKLCSYRLISAETMDKCSIILQNAKDKEPAEEDADAARAANLAAAAAALKFYGNGA
ncbi:unnamed protein product [Eruca vesicaria subsp. sativa]|uniref:Polycomb protein VEFS-Box domain-containing protein n=1 Tax=Eruca vesicaria subsp. sativa TaxID=29727 RepID=A0ABC8LL60_ERUVS|nr:unnamed protein product [Eruca vesicaria subsp. sativa]